MLSDVLGTENDLVIRDLEEEVDKKLLYMAMEKLSKGKENYAAEIWFARRARKTQKK